MTGWLPVRIDLDREPALVTEARVHWLEFGQMPLAEPFFRQTVARLLAASPPPRRMATDLATLTRAAARLPEVRPAGFIFHVSHCGSTLLANALKTVPGAAVASEPGALSALMRFIPDPGTAFLKSRWRETRRAVFDSLLRLYAHYRTGETETLAVKFASYNLMSMGAARAWYPATPCVVLVRNPSEVLVSQARGGGWKANSENLGEVFDWRGVDAATLSKEEYCARGLGQLFAAAVPHVGPQCQVVDYDDLNRKRVRELAAFLGLSLPPGRQVLEPIFSQYSKDPEGRIEFNDDRPAKRRLALGEINRAAAKWALPGYVELRGTGYC